MPSSCIFFYFLTEWTLHTLTQDFVLGGVAVRTGEPPRETQLLEPSPGGHAGLHGTRWPSPSYHIY